MRSVPMGGRERLHESSSFCRLNQGKGASQRDVYVEMSEGLGEQNKMKMMPLRAKAATATLLPAFPVHLLYYQHATSQNRYTHTAHLHQGFPHTVLHLIRGHLALCKRHNASGVET